MLDKNYPIVEFETTENALFIECGQNELSEKTLGVAASVGVSGAVGGEVPVWTRFITGLKASLKLEEEVKADATKSTVYKINGLNTLDISYLSYQVTMIDHSDPARDSKLYIIVEKEFDCRQSPKVEPGDRIRRVTFRFYNPDDPDPDVVKFQNAGDVLPVPDELFQYFERPVFISINSPQQQTETIGRLMPELPVADINMAFFVLENLNSSCKIKFRLFGDSCG